MTGFFIIKPMDKHQKNLIQIHIAVLLFGTAGLFGKFLSLSPSDITFGRVIFASFTLALILLLSGKSFRLNSTTDYFLLLIPGLVLVIHWIAFFYSIQAASVAIGLITYSTFPIWLAFIEPIVFKEKLKKSNFLLALLILVGIYFIVPTFKLTNAITKGALAGCFSGLTFAIQAILNRKFVSKYSGLVVSFYQLTFAALILLPFCVGRISGYTVHDFWLLGILGIICTAFAHTLFIQGMAVIKALLAGFIACLEPVYGVLFAIVLLNEIPMIKVVIGGVIVLGTVFLATILNKEHNQEKLTKL
jgi:drug/metabolite transporter (DMT)-like permease